MSTLFNLVKCSHAQGTNMASPMVTRSNGLVDYRTSANEADLRLDIVIIIFGLFPPSSSGTLRSRQNSGSA